MDYPPDLRNIISSYLEPELCSILNLPSNATPASVAQYAAYRGWISVLENIHINTTDIVDSILKGAAHGGTTTVLEWISISHNIVTRSCILDRQPFRRHLNVKHDHKTECGPISINDYLSSQNLDRYAIIAAGEGHINILMWILATKKTLPVGLIASAAEYEQIQTMEWIWTRQPSHELIDALQSAARNNKILSIMWLFEHNSGYTKIDVDYALARGAATGGHVRIMDLLRERGADDWNSALDGACEYGHLPAVEWLVARGADDWGTALYCATKYVHEHIIDWLMSHIPISANFEYRLDHPRILTWLQSRRQA